MIESAFDFFQLFSAQFVRARWFEYMGYGLIVVSALVLAAGVAWSVQRGLDGPSRQRFIGWSTTILSVLAIGSCLWLGYSYFNPPDTRVIVTEELLERLNKQQPEQEREIKINARLSSDQTVSVDGQEVVLGESEPVFAALARRMESNGLSLDWVELVFLIDPEATHGQVMQLISISGRAGFMRYKLELDR